MPFDFSFGHKRWDELENHIASWNLQTIVDIAPLIIDITKFSAQFQRKGVNQAQLLPEGQKGQIGGIGTLQEVFRNKSGLPVSRGWWDKIKIS